MQNTERRTAKPLTDEQIWGLDEKLDYECSLTADGNCPAGCNECIKFEKEMEFEKKQRSEKNGKTVISQSSLSNNN